MITLGTLFRSAVRFSGVATSISGSVRVNNAPSAITCTLGTSAAQAGQTLQPFTTITTGLEHGDEIEVIVTGTVDSVAETHTVYEQIADVATAPALAAGVLLLPNAINQASLHIDTVFPADIVELNGQSVDVSATLATAAELAAVRERTDNLPDDPADGANQTQIIADLNALAASVSRNQVSVVSATQISSNFLRTSAVKGSDYTTASFNGPLVTVLLPVAAAGDLTGAAVTFYAEQRGGKVVFASIAGEVLSPNTASQRVIVEVESTDWQNFRGECDSRLTIIPVTAGQFTFRGKLNIFS